ncbi:MAG: outer membrane protein assembly factor BamD, partial [Pseudomonadota bacterium]
YLAYRAGDYTEAVSQGKRFVQLYPTHKDAAYAQYLVGDSPLPASTNMRAALAFDRG